MDYSVTLSQLFNIKEDYAQNIITLLDDGNTIPFIARYRKEMHGSMDDQLIREFSEKLDYLRGLDKRREEIRELIAGQEKLTDRTGQRISFVHRQPRARQGKDLERTGGHLPSV